MASRVSFLISLAYIISLSYLVCAHTDDNDEHHDGHDHDHSDHLHKTNDQKQCDEATWSEFFIPSSKRESFWQGILSTVFIGAAPILCIKFVSTKDYWLKILLSFASGGLMGDVFLHLLPSALSLYESSNDEDDHHHHTDHTDRGYALLSKNHSAHN